MYVFGYSRTTSRELEIELDKAVLHKIIQFYMEEYSHQVKVCEELIRKLR